MRKLTIFLVAIGIFVFSMATSSLVYAQDPFKEVCNDKTYDSSTCGSINKQNNPLLGENGIITRVAQILVIVAGIASVIMIMIGGFKYMISSGDSTKVSSAKDTILYAVIGLVITVLAQAIVSFVIMRL